MDCEKYEPLLLDELYDELDELTSAAVKRHVAGCARCAAVLSGFRGTREAAVLPLEPIPDGLEERILAAAREAQKVVPIRSRMSRVLSVAGSWAMRPQTAMAAVFVLMIGTSAFLIRSGHHGKPASVAVIDVAGEPAPVAAAPAAETESLDDKAAASAHGPTPPVLMRPPPVATASAVAVADEVFPADPAKDAPAAKGKSEEGDMIAMVEKKTDTASNAYAPPPRAAGPAMRSAPGAAPKTASADRAEPWGLGGDPSSSSVSGAGASQQQAATDPKSRGAAEYRARNFAEATRQFDLAAQSGDKDAALWAARSTLEGQGCAVALGRFDRLSQSAAGTYVGNEASMRAARCEMNMGQYDSARTRLDKLAQVPSHRQEANQALSELNQQVASRKAGTTRAGGAVVAPAPAAPAPAPRAPQKHMERQSDTAHGF